MGKIWNEQESYAREVGLDQAIEYDGDNNAIYVGRCFPGALTSVASWQIYKMEYTSGNMTKLRWAGGSDAFTNIWDNRALLTYTDL